MHHPPAFPRSLSTTLRRSIGCSLLLLVGAAAHSEPMTERDLVRAFLASDDGQSALYASSQQSKAVGTPQAVLGNPEIEARHEESKGPAGATTNAIGGSMSLDLGFAAATENRAARIRSDAADYQRVAAIQRSLCALRNDAIDLWAARSSGAIWDTTTDRLQLLHTTLAAHATAGEASGHDRDLVGLAVSAHQLEAAEHRGEVPALQARLSSRLGIPVTEITFGAVPALPAWQTPSLLRVHTRPCEPRGWSERQVGSPKPRPVNP